MMDLKMTTNKISTGVGCSSGNGSVFQNLFLATIFINKSEIKDEITKRINSGNSHVY
jgi:hypothetical protein